MDLWYLLFREAGVRQGQGRCGLRTQLQGAKNPALKVLPGRENRCSFRLCEGRLKLVWTPVALTTAVICLSMYTCGNRHRKTGTVAHLRFNGHSR
jgi:hypothetical protein